MKTVSKPLSVWLAVLLLCTAAFCTPAAAEEESPLSLTVATVNGNFGDVVGVDILITQNPDVGIISFDLTYDPQQLHEAIITDSTGAETYCLDGAAATAANAYIDYIVRNNGPINMITFATNGYVVSGVLMTVYFRVVALPASPDELFSIQISNLTVAPTVAKPDSTFALTTTAGGVRCADIEVSQATERVFRLIEAVPDTSERTIVFNNEGAILAARAAYDALSDEEKTGVFNYDTLLRAEETLVWAKEERAEAERIMALIATLPETITREDKNLVSTVNHAFYEYAFHYNRDLIENADVLERAARIVRESNAAWMAQDEMDRATARSLFEVIESLRETVTEADRATVIELRATYEGFTDNQKKYVWNLDVLERAEAALGLPTPTTTDVTPSDALGDLDGDSKVTASDALAALKVAVGKITLTPELQALADLDGDRKVTASDALIILKTAVGK